MMGRHGDLFEDLQEYRVRQSITIVKESVLTAHCCVCVFSTSNRVNHGALEEMQMRQLLAHS